MVLQCTDYWLRANLEHQKEIKKTVRKSYWVSLSAGFSSVKFLLASFLKVLTLLEVNGC